MLQTSNAVVVGTLIKKKTASLALSKACDAGDKHELKIIEKSREYNHYIPIPHTILYFVNSTIQQTPSVSRYSTTNTTSNKMLYFIKPN